MSERGFTMSNIPSTHVEESQALLGKRTWLRTPVLLTLGGLVAILCLLSGCGSDSKPEAVSGKKEKTVQKTPGAPPLRSLGELRGGGAIKREPNAAGKLEITDGSGLTAEQLQKTWAAGLKQIESPNSEVAPGMTKQQLEAKMTAAHQKAQKMLQSGNTDKNQGITKAELEDRVQAARKKVASQREVVPGITKSELEDRVEAARRKVESRRVVLPGSAED